MNANPYSAAQIEPEPFDPRPSLLARLLAMSFDMGIMSAFCGFLLTLSLFYSGYSVSVLTNKMCSENPEVTPFHLCVAAGFAAAIFLAKDIFNGRSIAKRISRLQVVDNKTGIVASPFQTIIRNLFLIIWPLEALAIFVNPGQRLGDRVAGTYVVRYNPDITPQPRINYNQIARSFLITVAFCILFIRVLGWIPFSQDKKDSVAESRYNSIASSELASFYRSRAGKHASVRVIVYDATPKSNNYMQIMVYFLIRKESFSTEEEYRTFKAVMTSQVGENYKDKMYRGTIVFCDKRNTEYISIFH